MNEKVIEEQLEYIEKAVILDNYGVGLLLTVNESKYEDYMDVGYILNELEVNVDAENVVTVEVCFFGVLFVLKKVWNIDVKQI